MKNVDVIVQRVNDRYRATVLALPQIKTEGTSRDEALLRAQAAIEDFFRRAEVVSVSVDVPGVEFRPYATANDRLRQEALYPFPANDDEMNAQWFETIAAERCRDREEVARGYDEEEIQQRQRERRLEELHRRQNRLL